MKTGKQLNHRQSLVSTQAWTMAIPLCVGATNNSEVNRHTTPSALTLYPGLTVHAGVWLKATEIGIGSAVWATVAWKRLFLMSE